MLAMSEPDYAKLCTLRTTCLQGLKILRGILETSDDLALPNHPLNHRRELHHSR